MCVSPPHVPCTPSSCCMWHSVCWRSLSCVGWSNSRVQRWTDRQHMPKIALTWTFLLPFPLISSHPPSVFSLFVFSLYLDPPFLLLSLNPSARLLPDSCHLFPSLHPHESRGRLPGCTSGVWAFPSFIFQETCWPSLTAGSRWVFCKCSR